MDRHYRVGLTSPSIGEGFPGGASGKERAANAGDLRDVDSVPGSPRSSGEGNGNLLQYACLGHPWTEETGGPHFMGLQRAKHDRACTH